MVENMTEETAEKARPEAHEAQAEIGAPEAEAREEGRRVKARMRALFPEEFIEHSRNAQREMRAAWRSLLPDAFWEHRRAARREMLLAVRSLVDATIDRMIEASESRPGPQRRARRKIDVT